MFTSPVVKAIAAIVMSSGVLAGTASADTYSHLDNLAVRLQCQSRSLLREFQLHYRHTQEYRHLMSDGLQMYRLAAHVHEVAHHHGNIHHLESDLQKLDRLFHHLEDVLEHRHIHPHGGHTHGNVNHVHSQMRQIEDTLHHMLDDVRTLASHIRHHDVHGHGRGRGHGDDLYRNNSRVNTYPRTQNGGGIRIGNDRFSFRFGW